MSAGPRAPAERVWYEVEFGPIELQLIKREAEAAGWTVGDWIHYALSEEIRRLKAAHIERVRQGLQNSSI